MEILELDDLLFGSAPHPVTCGNGLSIGSGAVVPEINFTLAATSIEDLTWSKIRSEYREVIEGILERARTLHAESLLVEFETLPPMISRPEWALELTEVFAEKLSRFSNSTGVRTALRFTPNDLREFSRPPRMRRGEHWERMLEVFENAEGAGADLLAIESTGGKEIFDDALLEADMAKIVFSLGILGARDMRFLWDQIVAACAKSNLVPSGDTACGFANTAMVLADKKMIPRTLAAVVRVATVPRSLIAYEAGARGPSKDCAYEGPYMKVLRGVPISMEGRTAACAHLSPVGNISQAVCDCWSNESVQNIRVLSDRAPVMSLEQLVYDCRLMNTVLARGKKPALDFRDCLSDSDSVHDPQAFVLRPDVVLRISRKIARTANPYRRTIIAARACLEELENGYRNHALKLDEKEVSWLGRIARGLEGLPEEEDSMIDLMLSSDLDGKFLPGEYAL